MMEFVEKYKKARGAYPDSWSVQAYDSVYLLKAAIEKAKTIDTDAVIKALEGMTVDSLRGKFTVRPSIIWERCPVIREPLRKTPPMHSRSGKTFPGFPGAGHSA